MKALFYLLWGCLVLVLAQPGQACSCAGGGPFLNIAQWAAWQPNTLMVRVQVVGRREHGIEVRVLNVLHGSEDRSTIMVWGDPGFMCRQYVTGYQSGERLIFILRRLQPSSYAYQNEQPGDYELGGCGTYALRENGTVTGRISDNLQKQSYASFRQTLFELLDASAPDKPKVYPIPATTDLTIDIPQQSEAYLLVNLVSPAGTVLQSHQLSTGKTHQLPIAPLAGGLYIIRFESEHTRFSRRIIKQ